MVKISQETSEFAEFALTLTLFSLPLKSELTKVNSVV